MTLSSGKKTLITLGIIIITMLGVYYFVFSRIKSSNENSSSLLEQVSLEQERSDFIHSTKALVDNTSSDIGKLDSYFVGKDNVVGFINYVESLGRQTGVSISVDSINTNLLSAKNPSNTTGAAAKQQSVSASSTVEVLNMTVNALGSWQNIFRFLSLLENMPYSSSLSDVKISLSDQQTGKKGNAAEWKGDFSLNVLKLK